MRSHARGALFSTRALLTTILECERACLWVVDLGLSSGGDDDDDDDDEKRCAQKRRVRPVRWGARARWRRRRRLARTTLARPLHDIAAAARRSPLAAAQCSSWISRRRFSKTKTIYGRRHLMMTAACVRARVFVRDLHTHARPHLRIRRGASIAYT